MNARLKETNLSPGRERLHAALTALAECRRNSNVAQALVESSQKTIDAETAVRAELDAVTAAEKNELMAWVEAGSIGEEPSPHDKARQAVEKRLRIAKANAEIARRRLAGASELVARLAAESAPLVAAVHAAKLAVITEVGIKHGEQFQQQIFDACRREIVVSAGSQLLADQHGRFEPVIHYTVGDPSELRQRAAAGVSDGWMQLWDALDSDAGAELKV